VKLLVTVISITVVVIGGFLLVATTPTVHADVDNNEAALVKLGFEISPVKLNLAGKDPDLVGLGSYIVNAASDCNSCHNAGTPPNFDYLPGRNPYFGQRRKKLDPRVYFGGGQPFGMVGTPTGPNAYAGPLIVSRNLTPDKTGRAEGGHTLAEFKQILRHGTDMDNLHPTCTAAQIADINAGGTPGCIPTSPDNPVDGNLLQIMPWPTYSKMTDHYVDAIYEFLSSIPCYEGPTDPTDPLHNDCN
jgi:hypothetical protein